MRAFRESRDRGGLTGEYGSPHSVGILVKRLYLSTTSAVVVAAANPLAKLYTISKLGCNESGADTHPDTYASKAVKSLNMLPLCIPAT